MPRYLTCAPSQHPLGIAERAPRGPPCASVLLTVDLSQVRRMTPDVTSTRRSFPLRTVIVKPETSAQRRSVDMFALADDGGDLCSPVCRGGARSGCCRSFCLANVKRRVLPRAFCVLAENTRKDQRSLATPSKRESQGLTIMPFTSLRNAAVSTTSENGWIDMTISSMYACTPS